MSVRDVLIVGGGPAGLATAIASRHHRPRLPGCRERRLVDAIFRFPSHMVFFTTPELLEIGGLPLTTPYEKPTQARGAALLPQGRGHLPAAGGLSRGGDRGRTRTAMAMTRIFVVETRSGRGSAASARRAHVVLAIGYYDRPNRLGVPGEDLPHVAHYYGEPHPYYRQRVVIVGGKNSAAKRRSNCYRAGAHVTLVHRGAALRRLGQVLGAARHRESHQGGIDRGAVRDASWRSVRPRVVVRRTGEARPRKIPAERVLLLTGYHADAGFLRGAGVELNPRRHPRHDAVTFETNVPNLFVAGGAARRQAHRHHLHRERPFSRRAGGHGLSRAPRPAAPADRDQADAPRSRRRRQPRSLRARGPAHEPAHPPQHRRGVRLRPQPRRRVLLRDGVPRRHRPRAPRAAVGPQPRIAWSTS